MKGMPNNFEEPRVLQSSQQQMTQADFNHRSSSAKENTTSKKEARQKHADPLADIKANNSHARDKEYSADQNINQSSNAYFHYSNHHTRYFTFAPSTSTKPNSQHASYYHIAPCTSLQVKTESYASAA